MKKQEKTLLFDFGAKKTKKKRKKRKNLNTVDVLQSSTVGNSDSLAWLS